MRFHSKADSARFLVSPRASAVRLARLQRGIGQMRAARILQLLTGALLLAWASSSWATPPQQHLARGTIQSIDYETRTLTLTPAKAGDPIVFFWNHWTSFRHRGHRVCSGAMKPEMIVKIYYRREAGRWVPHWVILQRDAEARCATGECHPEHQSTRE